MSGRKHTIRAQRVHDIATGIAIGRVAHMPHKRDPRAVVPTADDVAIAEMTVPLVPDMEALIERVATMITGPDVTVADGRRTAAHVIGTVRSALGVREDS